MISTVRSIASTSRVRLFSALAVTVFSATGAAAPPWPAPSADNPQIVYYEIVARFLSGRFRVVERRVSPAASARLLTAGAAAPADCARDPHCRSAEVPAGAPLELAFWLALVDRFRDAKPEPPDVVSKRGQGTTHSDLQSRLRRDVGETGGKTASAARALLRFKVGGGIACDAQHRVFYDQITVVRPAAPTDHKWARRLRLSQDGRGTIVMKLIGDFAPKGPVYTLSVYVAEDVDGRIELGRSIATAIRCTAAKPIVASATGIQHGAADENGTPKAWLRVALP